MKQISSLELHFLLKELKPLINSRIDNIYNSGKDKSVFQLHKSNVGKLLLKIIIGKAIFISEDKESDERPSGFCQLLRKYLDGKFLSSINHIEPERILELIFESKNEKIKVYLEFFNPGNIVVCDYEDTIISALNIKKFKIRNILPKEKYSYPRLKYNFLKIKENELADFFKTSQKDKLVTSLAIELGLGGVYSEEICIISKIDKNINPKEIANKDITSIFEAVKEILNEKIAPKAIFSQNEIIDAIPFDLLFYKNFEKKNFENFSNALDFYYSSMKEERKSNHESKLEGIKEILENQILAMEQLKQEEKENREKAELMYHKYQLINEILTEINKATKKYSWKEVKEKLKGHKIIKDINLKDKTIMIEI